MKKGRRESGQVMVLFGLSLVGLVGLLALVLDGANLYIQRRTAQNAADAAALAGTRTLAHTTTSPSNAVAVDVCSYLQANSFGFTPTASAYLVDGNGNYVGALDLTNGVGGAACVGTPFQSILAGAGGVHVDASISFNTFLLGTLQRALHVAPQDGMTATASATAHVWQYSINGNFLAPFAVCGGNAPTDSSAPGGGKINLFLSGTHTIDPSLYGTNVVLEDSHINSGSSGWLPSPPTCPQGSGSSWKGKINPPADTLVAVPMPAGTGLPPDTGNGAIAACGNTHQTSPCYLWVPVTDDQNPSSGDAHIVTFACMQVYGGSGNPKWQGILADPAFCPYTPYQSNWTWTPTASTANTRIALTT